MKMNEIVKQIQSVIRANSSGAIKPNDPTARKLSLLRVELIGELKKLYEGVTDIQNPSLEAFEVAESIIEYFCNTGGD